MMFAASSASGSSQYLLAKHKHASASLICKNNKDIFTSSISDMNTHIERYFSLAYVNNLTASVTYINAVASEWTNYYRNYHIIWHTHGMCIISIDWGFH